MSARPIVWSVGGLDSGGGAGLAADQRAADACGVHLCTAAAALTAQNSVAVQGLWPVPAEQLDAQLAALADDLPPRAIKTGLLGSVDNVRVLAHWVDRLRARAPVALVVDPVLRASTGAAFADAALIAAYRAELLPRASVVTPNRREAAALLDRADAVPTLARALQGHGSTAVCITGGDADGTLASDWLATPQAEGWLSLPRRPARNAHGTGCCHATGLAAALARGFVAADAAVLAKMLTASGLHDGPTPGPGAGPVAPRADFVVDAPLLPTLADQPAPPPLRPTSAAVRGVYGITDDAEHAARLFADGLATVQLRLKRSNGEELQAWQARLQAQIRTALAAARRAGATLIVNDHWRAALALGADFVHLGQEDLLALDAEAKGQLVHARERGLRLGLSTHSLWELARAAAWAPDYVACGPVWPTVTKAMPWTPQGLDNLSWWAAMAPAPVVAIGGLLQTRQLADAAAVGAAAACVVRGLRTAGAPSVADWQDAWHAGAARRELPGAAWPHPTLDP